MRNINYFDKELSVEEYVKKEVCKNAGTQSVAFKEQLISLCSSAGIECNEKMKKEELFDLLCNNGFEYKQFADLFGIGVSSQVYQSAYYHLCTLPCRRKWTLYTHIFRNRWKRQLIS